MLKGFIATALPVLSFDIVNDSLYAIVGENILSACTGSGKITNSKKAFEKEGLSRMLWIDGDYLYCKNFCTLHVLCRTNLEPITRLQLGEDLSSDIYGVTFDDKHIYAALRGGSVAAIQKHSFSLASKNKVSNTSIWDIKSSGKYLYAGNVSGCLLRIDKDGMRVSKSVQPHSQNLRSLILLNDSIFTVSQDKSLAQLSLAALQPLHTVRNLHKKMFHLGGVWRQYLVTISYPCGEIKFWNLCSFALEKTLFIPKALSGDIKIVGDLLYLSSRMISGIQLYNLCDMP